MLISPSHIHSLLTSLLSPLSTSGPHTALLILPQGQLLSSAFIDQDEGEDGNEDEDEEEEGEDEDNEPYLEKPERLRLLLGLASQWNEGESQKMECELGRLHFTSIPLPTPSSSEPNLANPNFLPAIRPPTVERFVLVLNGTVGTGWGTLGEKSEAFKKGWKA
ncbi:hypothetical protein CI109_104328 [Kwoniella shandongensis]|uniref:Uncharacterized protein n=1 Tax=Kwoniella shandongensis TaxID=1734106 RepID=A0AAJ8LJT4_9TREE